MTNFDVGDLVRLKSGGPTMTITSTPNEYSALCFCQWFDEMGALNKGRFPPDALIKAEKR